MTYPHNPLCIFHADCPDGWTAAWVVHHAYERLGVPVELRSANYGDHPPEVTGRDVTIVDFSYPKPVMERIIRYAHAVRVLDHHKTAAEDLAGLDLSTGAVVIFDMERSGAMLAWDYFHGGEPAPDLVRYVQDRDLWRHALPYTAEVFAAITARPYTLEAWDALHDMPSHHWIREGRGIAMYRERLIEQAIDLAAPATIGGHQVLAANCSHAIGSDVAGRLAAGRAFGAYYFMLPDGRRKWGLRSSSDGADVGEIARMYDGGGHAHASGFTEGLTSLSLSHNRLNPLASVRRPEGCTCTEGLTGLWRPNWPDRCPIHGQAAGK